MRCLKFPLIKFLIIIPIILSCTKPEESTNNVFISGIDGYNTYRIPALVKTNSGTLLAFCEGRKVSSSDAGDVDLLLKRSDDLGNTWSSQQIIWDDGQNTCGNPCPILDRETDKIHLLMTWNRGDDSEREIINGVSSDTRRVFVTSSSDDGNTWSNPKEITQDVKLTNWTWYATGPGGGIQIEQGNFKGRLVAPCDHIEADTKHYYSHIIYSDDHGESWKLGGSTLDHQVNECQVAEISEDRLMLNMRNYDKSKNSRQVAISKDGGISWSDQKFDEELIEPICQASLQSYSWTTEGKRKYLFFSNPADTSERIKMTIKVSKDEGGSWNTKKEIYSGPSAYSDLEIIEDNLIACLFEAGENSPYQYIKFIRIPISKFNLE